MFTLMPVAAFAATADGYVTVAGEEKYTATAGKAFTATVTSGGVVEGLLEGDVIITAEISVDGVEYSDTCTVVVTPEDTGA